MTGHDVSVWVPIPTTKWFISIEAPTVTETLIRSPRAYVYTQDSLTHSVPVHLASDVNYWPGRHPSRHPRHCRPSCVHCLHTKAQLQPKHLDSSGSPQMQHGGGLGWPARVDSSMRCNAYAARSAGHSRRSATVASCGRATGRSAAISINSNTKSSHVCSSMAGKHCPASLLCVG